MAGSVGNFEGRTEKSNTSWDIISNSVREITRIIFDIRANLHREIILLKDEEQDTDS